MSFAAMDFLLAAMRRQTRRLLFEQWLLLAVRTLLIVAVVLAVAEPYFERAGMAFVPGSHVHRVLVFDGSYSMAYKPADKTRFENAKQIARQIVNESPQGDAFTLVLMSSRPRVIVGAAALEPTAILQEIDNLELPHTTADLPAAIPAIRQLIEKAAANNPRLDRHEVYFLTDLQRTTWAPQLTESARAQFLEQTRELAKSASLFVIDLGQPTAANLAITDLHAADSLLTVGRDVPLQVRMQHFGPAAGNRQLVELFVDGRRIAQSTSELSPDGSGTAEFSCRFDVPGDYTIEARAPGDELDVDNHRYLELTVRQAIRVLCIDGRPSGGSFHGPADYLAVALQPQGDAANRSPLQTEVAAESALLERNLANYDSLFLCNVAQFTASEARALDAYLQGGGCLVFFLGDQVQTDRYNRELGVAGEGRAGGLKILPARIGNVVDQPQFRLDPLGYRHPILEAFRGRGQNSLLTTPVFKHYRLAPSKQSQATTVLALGNGDPLIVEQPVHRGHVVLIGTSAEPSWTALPLWPSFVPLVQEIVAWSAAGQLQQRNILAGEPLDALTSSAGMTPASVQSPDGRKRPAQLQPAGDRFALTYAGTWQSGIYTVQFGTPASRGQTFAVNVDTLESNLAQATPDDVRSDTWPGIPFACQPSWQEIKSTGISTPHGRRGLHVNLLYTALGLALAEVMLTWKLGGRG